MKDKIVLFITNLLNIKDTDNSIIKNIKKFIINNKELVLYIIVGASTTFINLLIYFTLLFCFDHYIFINAPSWQIAELIAFAIAVIYSFYMDKYVVFNSKFINIYKLLFEFFQFVVTRILVEALSYYIMHIMIDIYYANAYLVKVIVMVLIIVLNYITSKFIIFRK